MSGEELYSLRRLFLLGVTAEELIKVAEKKKYRKRKKIYITYWVLALHIDALRSVMLLSC